jgi:hypothetical protein
MRRCCISAGMLGRSRARLAGMGVKRSDCAIERLVGWHYAMGMTGPGWSREMVTEEGWWQVLGHGGQLRDSCREKMAGRVTYRAPSVAS